MPRLLEGAGRPVLVAETGDLRPFVPLLKVRLDGVHGDDQKGLLRPFLKQLFQLCHIPGADHGWVQVLDQGKTAGGHHGQGANRV